MPEIARYLVVLKKVRAGAPPRPHDDRTREHLEQCVECLTHPALSDNLVRRIIIPALSRRAVCRKQEGEHKPESHVYQRDKSLPEWHGWHAFRRGLATNLHSLGIADKEIQAILRHSNIGLTQNIYVKSLCKSQVSATDTLSEKLGTCNDLATTQKEPVN